MDFEKNVPEWRAEGTEPPESLKDSGFQVGYKPPAPYFNWFWNRVSACLTEIREKLSGHASNKENPHGVTAAQLGLDKVNNTSDTEKCVAFASEAGVARKSEYSLTVRLNGGRTESTDQFTYDGSTSRTVNITPEKIGASEKDLSNVDDAVFKDKASGAGVGIPIADATSADGIAYTATVEGVSELYNGLIITIVPAINSAATNTTLNVNGLGEKMIRLPLSFNNAAMSMPKMDTYITAGRPLTLQYDAAYLNGDGIWKVFGKQKTSAQDLYGTVPVESGGTDASDAAGARQNLGVPSVEEMMQRDRVANLLDNSDFQIWQRGTTFEDTPVSQYHADRWRGSGNAKRAYTKVHNGCRVTAQSANTFMGITQKIPAEKLEPGRYTLVWEFTPSASCKTYNGTEAAAGVRMKEAVAITVTSDNIAAGSRAAEAGIMCMADNSPISIGFYFDVHYVDFYKGAYTTDNAPLHHRRGYAAELAECQRYYENSYSVLGLTSKNEYIGAVISGTILDCLVPFAVPKRIQPTITLHPVYPAEGWRVYNNLSYYMLGNAEPQVARDTKGFNVRGTKASDDTSTWTQGAAIPVMGHWEASADL